MLDYIARLSASIGLFALALSGVLLAIVHNPEARLNQGAEYLGTLAFFLFLFSFVLHLFAMRKYRS